MKAAVLDRFLPGRALQPGCTELVIGDQLQRGGTERVCVLLQSVGIDSRLPAVHCGSESVMNHGNSPGPAAAATAARGCSRPATPH